MRSILPAVALVLVFNLLCIVKQADPARILAVIPTPSYSHQVPFRRLWLELHERGHEIVLVTSNPIPNMNSTTFKQIDIGGAYKAIRSINFIKNRFDKIDWLTFIENELFDMSATLAEHVLNHTDMKAIYAHNSNEKFDLVMAEMLAIPAVYVFAHRFNAPLIVQAWASKTCETDVAASPLRLLGEAVPTASTPTLPSGLQHDPRGAASAAGYSGIVLKEESEWTWWGLPRRVGEEEKRQHLFRGSSTPRPGLYTEKTTYLKRLTSLGILASNEHALGGVVLPSHEYTWEMEANVGLNQPFWKRLRNFLKISRVLYVMYRDTYPNQQKLVEKYFGTPLPSILDIQKNTSLIFVNQADPITPARPKLANMITFTSFHVDKNQPPLPEDLKRFVDSATEGFIYFSLGSNAMSSDLPPETLQVFYDVFAKLPYKIVWKFEKDMPNKPDNIFVGKWLPQQSILGHPNIKLFIYQGGLQSSEEAVHFSVPLLGFPVLADQDYQVLRMQELGVGKHMDLTTVAREELEAAILEIINNKQYKERIVELKKIVNDNPYNMVEHLAWWTEYVIRHKGAPHLRSNLAHQPWYQRCDMDIVVFLTIVAVLVISNVASFVAKLAVRCYNHYQTISTFRKQKLS